MWNGFEPPPLWKIPHFFKPSLRLWNIVCCMKYFSFRGPSFVHTRVCGRERGNCLTAWILHAAPGSVWSPPPGSWRLGPGPGYTSGRPSQRSTRPMVPVSHDTPRTSSASNTGLFCEYCKYCKCILMSNLKKPIYQWSKQQRTLKGVSTMDLLVLTEDPFHLLRQRLMHK